MLQEKDDLFIPTWPWADIGLMRLQNHLYANSFSLLMTSHCGSCDSQHRCKLGQTGMYPCVGRETSQHRLQKLPPVPHPTPPRRMSIVPPSHTQNPPSFPHLLPQAPLPHPKLTPTPPLSHHCCSNKPALPLNVITGKLAEFLSYLNLIGPHSAVDSPHQGPKLRKDSNIASGPQGPLSTCWSIQVYHLKTKWSGTASGRHKERLLLLIRLA